MKRATFWNKRSLSVSVQSAGLVLAAATLSGFSLSATAQELKRVPPAVEVLAPEGTLAGLERVFWECDHAAAVHGVVDASMGILCGAATEDLRLKKFNGDFKAMLGWWQQNKAREHRALDRAMRAAAHR